MSMPAFEPPPRFHRRIEQYSHELNPSLRNGRSAAETDNRVNVGSTERVISAGIGAAFTAYGLFQSDFRGLMLAALGAGLVCRGVTGECHLYRALGISTAESSLRPLTG